MLYGEAPHQGPVVLTLLYNITKKRYPFHVPSVVESGRAPLSIRLLHPSSEPLIFSTGENKQLKPLILCHCIYSLPLITGAFLNIFKWLETYHSLSEFLLNEIEWHAFSLQRYSFSPFVRNKPVSTQRLTSNQNSTHSNVKSRSNMTIGETYTWCHLELPWHSSSPRRFDAWLQPLEVLNGFKEIWVTPRIRREINFR